MNTSLLEKFKKSYSSLEFIQDDSFYWSPQDMAIHYNAARLTESEEGEWSLVHELAHGLLGHKTYKTDYELLSYEVAAWQKALEIAPEYDLNINANHIEECLDSYRDWLYARSTCPTCKLNSLQVNPDTYKCLNCLCKWRVSPSRFCRPYRLKTKTPSEVIPQMVFAEKAR
jgi:hypothetical protein